MKTLIFIYVASMVALLTVAIQNVASADLPGNIEAAQTVEVPGPSVVEEPSVEGIRTDESEAAHPPAEAPIVSDINVPTKTAAPQMERIPFTQEPVQAGNPESYIGTYGQCPFYENAGEKGCFPPADIKCNDDWSKCEYVK